MTVIQYPREAFYLVCTSPVTLCGSYELPVDGELSLCNIRVFNKRVGPYSYTMKLEVSASVAGQALVTSDIITFSDATTGQTGSDWLGDVTFSFPEYSLRSGEVYYFRLVTTGYTRPLRPNENTAYLAINCDWLEPIGNSDTGGARMPLGVKI